MQLKQTRLEVQIVLLTVCSVQENTLTEKEVKVLDVENDENKKKLEAINKEIQALERKK